MANPQNVAAIETLLEQFYPVDPGVSGVSLLEIARGLAARGVLVPSALTDEQCEELGVVMMTTTRVNFRAQLARIARGDGEAGG